MRDRGIRWLMAEYAVDILKKNGQPIHWLVLAASIDHALVKGGARPRMGNDPKLFNEVMHLAKVLGMHQGDNAFPLYENKGYWALGSTGADLSTQLIAVRQAAKACRSRLSLLARQMESEQVRVGSIDRVRTQIWLEAERDSLFRLVDKLEPLIEQAKQNGTP